MPYTESQLKTCRTVARFFFIVGVIWFALGALVGLSTHSVTRSILGIGFGLLNTVIGVIFLSLSRRQSGGNAHEE